MLEIVGDIWRYAGSAVIAITTRGSAARGGKAVIGRGVASQAVVRFPDFAETLGAPLHEKAITFLTWGTVW